MRLIHSLRKYQNRLRYSRNEGFTLIELMVVIMIISMLAAIALPAFLSQSHKARQSEAKMVIGAMNRSQQAYFLEKGKFSPTIELLGLGVPSTSSSYRYETGNQIDATTVSSDAFSLHATLKPYIGRVAIVSSVANGSNTASALCENKMPKAGYADEQPTVDTSGVICQGGLQSTQ